jgi:hypothetical protein
MNIFYIFRYLYYYTLFLCVKFTRFFQPTQELVIKPKTDIEIYESSYNKRFLKIFNEPSLSQDNDLGQNKYNSNIDPILYNRKELLEELKDPNNEYEKKWQKNILYETTPRGNIAMHYDIFKQGFAYYADQSITYNMLNVAAMKYCVYFSCRDFFIDEKILPELSPFTKIILEEEKVENDKKNESVKKMIPNMVNARLAKLKNYSIQPELVKTELVKPESTDKMYIMNKFIYLGKTNNFSFIQKVPIKKVTIKEPSSFDAMFTDIQIDKDKRTIDKDKMDYKAFKLLQNALKDKTE